MLTLEHEPGHAGQEKANKMYTCMKQTFSWHTMVADVASLVTNCLSSAKGNVKGRRRSNLRHFFPATDPFADVCLALLGPLPGTAYGCQYLLGFFDRFKKPTRVVLIPKQDAETAVSAFMDTWVSSYGPPDALLTHTGPQLTSAHFREVLGTPGVRHVTSTAYHPKRRAQLNGTTEPLWPSFRPVSRITWIDGIRWCPP